MAAEAPTGTVTFLFTDIEGSTRLWEQYPEAMAAALARHDEIAKSAFEAHGGHVFATGGDGFAVAFGRAADGLAAAGDCQAALAAEPWDDAVIRVRMGLHVGEAEERAGDYFGPAVNRAARIMSAGHGGQILATEACAQVVGSESFIELGEFRLRDLSGPQRLFQVGEGSFPRLRTIDAYPSNLPQNLSTFVGRQEQVARLVEDLGRAQLVTLTGTGGVGKTRLAVQACAEALPKFPAGAWFVDLATVRDPEQIAYAVASALDVKERPGEALEVTLRDYLRDREAIVLLDNGEHLVDELAELIDELRSRRIAAKFLITSREPLGIDGEQVRRVVSLDGDESVELFTQRAAAARGEVDWTLYGDEVAEICARLDGIPLAIELAAARCRSMLPAEILERLDERFRLLAGGKRNARERHQTLLAAVEWSYDLLDDGEQTLFDRLATFRGGFTLAAAEAICVGEPVEPMQVVDLLDRLVDKSMVLVYESGDRSRYHLLETLRQFGESRLVESGQADEYRDRHARHYVEFANSLKPLIGTTEQRHAAAELAGETANLDATMGWLVASGRWIETARLCGDLKIYWGLTGLAEGPRWYRVLLDNIDEFELEQQAKVLAEAAYTICFSEAGVAGRHAEESLAAAERSASEPSPFAYHALSFAALKDGDDQGAVEYARLADELIPDDLTEPWPSNFSLLVSAEVDLQSAAAPSAVAELSAYAAARGIPVLLAGARCAEGRLASLAGEHDSADQMLTDAIDMSRGYAPSIVIVSTTFRAESRLRAGDGCVLEGIHEALEMFAETPAAPDAVADLWSIVATIWLRQGRVEDAAVLGCAAGALLMSLGFRGRARHAYIREQLGDDLAAALTQDELDAHVAAAREMTADDVRRFIFERL